MRFSKKLSTFISAASTVVLATHISDARLSHAQQVQPAQKIAQIVQQQSSQKGTSPYNAGGCLYNILLEKERLFPGTYPQSYDEALRLVRGFFEKTPSTNTQSLAEILIIEEKQNSEGRKVARVSRINKKIAVTELNGGPSCRTK